MEIASFIERLRGLSHHDIQDRWHGSLTNAATPPSDWATWAIASRNQRQHIAWEQGRQSLWLAQAIQVPPDRHGYPLAGLTLRLALTWWAELAEIYVDGQQVQVGDLFDHSTRILLSPAVQPGDVWTVWLHLISPGHDPGALVQSRLIYETSPALDLPTPEPSFVADELAVLHRYSTAFAPAQLADMEAAIAAVDWAQVTDRLRWHQALAQLRDRLRPSSAILKQRRLSYLGHAHLDLAWLWPVADTWAAAERTFTSVLSLQAQCPDLIFAHTSPVLYAWLEEHRPALFTQIQQQIQAGQWEVVAGLWLEPELNLISGEAIARHILYGQRYVQQRFGQVNQVAWLPDTFGFCWQLPQLLRQGEVTYFVTQKLRWNDTTTFPYGLFYWRSPDGSEILSLMSAPIGEGMDPLKMADYAIAWEQQTSLTEALWLPGVGDHGGGPTRDMLDVGQRWQQSPFFPQMQSTSALGYLQQVESAADQAALPVWADELYLELHRGCYTTHADQKRRNRRGEDLLYLAEFYAAIATGLTDQPYPQTTLETAWKHLLFNQFHDILPGSAIPEVFQDADRDWTALETLGSAVLATALTAIAAAIPLPPPPHPEALPVLVLNPCQWPRSPVVEIPGPTPAGWQVVDAQGQVIPSQVDYRGDRRLAQVAVPGWGYRVIWCQPWAEAQAPLPSDRPPILENAYLRVVVDPTTGDLQQVYDQQGRAVLSGAGNQLQAFADDGQYWDAWNIDPNYAQRALAPSQLQHLTWLEQGPVRSRLRVVRQIGQSTFQQDYVLDEGSPWLRIESTVAWQERHVLVKTAFPLTVEAEQATYEIPYGAIARPTRPQTPAEAAKWEVPALRWADLSQADYGVSVLNDCKYGYDATPHQLRLSLLRGSTWPDPQADLGEHEFTIALYPHAGDWRAAQTVRHGYDLNRPCLVRSLSVTEFTSDPDARDRGQFLSLASEHWIGSSLKQAEEATDRWVIRGYNSTGIAGDIQLNQGASPPWLTLTALQPVNLLEQPQGDRQAPPTLTTTPWTIQTWTAQLQRSRPIPPTPDQ